MVDATAAALLSHGRSDERAGPIDQSTGVEDRTDGLVGTRPGHFHDFEVSADGRKFHFIRAEPDSRPTRLDVFPNWLPELPRTVGSEA